MQAPRMTFPRTTVFPLLALLQFTSAISAGQKEVAPPGPGKAGWLWPPEESRPTGLIVQIENDLWGGSDENYTSGLRAVYAMESHTFADVETWSLAQIILNPEDIYEEELDEDDRPYAGFLHLGYAVHDLRGEQLRLSYGINLGVVGPSSLGEAAQNAYHDLRDIDRPVGWDEQIKDEPIIQFSHEVQFRPMAEPTGEGWDTDLLVIGAASLGNGFIYAEGGTEVRAGWNLAPRWATSLVSPGMAASSPLPWAEGMVEAPRLRFEAFAGVRGRLVGRDITLDGNTFQDSRSVDKNWAVGDVYAGLGWGYGWFSMTFTETYRTPEFEGQEGGQFFGTLTLNISF